jgi:hypothetical protein
MSLVLAHGGTAGAIAEGAAALGIVALGLAFWVGNRRAQQDEQKDEGR